MTRNFRSLVLPDVIATRGMLISWLTLAVSLLITLWAWQLAQVNAGRTAHDRFYFRINAVKIAIADRLRDYEAVLRGAQGFFNASDEVTRKEWRASRTAAQVRSVRRPRPDPAAPDRGLPARRDRAATDPDRAPPRSGKRGGCCAMTRPA